MALFNVSNGRAQFDAAGNEPGDVYGAGVRLTQAGATRVTTTAGTNFNGGIPMSSTGQVSVVDATAGLPAGTMYLNGLPISNNAVCVSRNAAAVVSNGLPFDSAGAVAGDINLDLNFVGATSLNSSVTFTRASTATFFNSAGVLTSAAINAPRFDYNPSTLAAQGLLIEESRTNSIRNNTMVGAVAGTPGTAPTNWAGLPTTSNGLSRQIVGTGTENGITYVDVRYSGTTTAAAFLGIRFEPNNQIAAVAGQTWTATAYVSLAGGSTTNVSSVDLVIEEYSSVPASLASSSSVLTISSGSLNTRRQSLSRTLTNAATAFVQPWILLQYPSGVAIDITLRIGLPQLELGAFATSVIPTTTTALTRAADVATINTLSPWYNATEGTLYVEGYPIAPTSSFIRVASVETAGAVANVISIQRNGTDARGFGDGASTIISAGMPQNAVFKSALAAKINDFALTSNGVAPNADTATNALPTAAAMGLGSTIIGTSVFSGYLRRITYYPRRLANADLQAITA